MRLQIARRTELVVRVLQVLATGGRHKGAALADAVSASASFLPQVLQPAVSAGWVRSVPGPTGGYELAVPLASISVLAVIEASEGPTDDGRCVLEERDCGTSGPCALHESWAHARYSLTHSLAKVSLDTLTEPIDTRSSSSTRSQEQSS